jgi:nitronate monooxygenase
MKWTTKVTELLGCRYPILQGALAGLGNWQFAAAVANAGAHGVITASVSRTPEQLRTDIRKCRDETSGCQGSFGVNLTFVSMSLPEMKKMLEVCIEERVPIETAAYRPDSLAPRIKESGLPWIHKTARIRDAVFAESLGVDAVIVVGLEGVGFKNPEQLPTLTTITWGVRQLKIPLIASGGIGDARGLLGALGMGAEGIMMGTAFMATKECPMTEKAKQALVESSAGDPEVYQRVLFKANPKDYLEVMRLRAELPLDKWLRVLERVNRRDPNWREAITESSGAAPRRISRLGSLAVGVIDQVPTVKELIDNIIKDAETSVNSWKYLKPD